MIRRGGRAALLLAALVAASPLAAPAQTNAPAAAGAPTLDDALAAIRAYAPRALAEQGAPGMAVAITDRTHTLAIVTSGVADVAANAPVTAQTRFPIGLISKSMTALALLQLRDRGKIDLDAPVQRYLPGWSIRGGGPIAIHRLLSHTAGIPDDYTIDGGTGYEIAALRGAHTLFTPGTSWSYSNDGFATAGAVAAAVAGMPWPQLVQSTVFAPLGMAHSSPAFTQATMRDAAVGYLFADDAVATPPHPPLTPAQAIDYVDAAGSVISAPEDMAQYMRFYLNGGAAGGRPLLAASTFRAMTTPDRFANGAPAGAASPVLAEWPEFYRAYGYGLAIFDVDGDHLVGHTGGISGYTACMQVNLTGGFGVIAMSNLVEAPLHPCAIVKYAMAVLHAQQRGRALPPAPAGPPIPPPHVVAADYAGTYTARDGKRVTVTADGGALTLVDGGRSYRLEPRGDDLFWTDDPALPIYFVAFHRNAAKAVDAFMHGSVRYAGARAAAAPAVASPPAWRALTGRYETLVWGTPLIVRIVDVGGRLTADGVTPLAPRPDGSFAMGGAIVRFDTPLAGAMQRMQLDGSWLYRVELP